ncbi:ABC transporter ATP-binding protein [Rhodoferax saidenbachensis]|uniref:ABC transporter ATP-binding protein n=1 Tax=Rhodoferax saidenbachensis TaxID=1484693 RepID=A0A1P8K989_9BURK|nr:ABC transporter ATP-binding protein [Rhodoferax saidenbachensis]APW42561.1 ABC transporter ATP-binding protein [Rhodoferax saidenbachensis]
MTFLDLSAVRKSYGPVVALDTVSLAVPEGSRTAIVGASGSGKTTLLRIIAGFDLPDAGKVVLGGQLLADGPQAVPAHQRGIGYVAQDGALFPHLRIADNVGFGLPRDTPQRQARIAELMDMVALDTAMLQRYPHELSGGQQQRVALARALAQRPRLMLLDEPFSALDTGLRAATRKAVAQLLQSAGITTILVTHDQAEALSFADQVAVMRNGQLAQVGKPLDLYQRPADPVTARFLGEAMVLSAQISNGWAECSLGRIPVGNTQYSGSGQIMLRPEQLRLEDLSHPQALQNPNAASRAAVVLEADFCGPTCEVVVRLLHSDEMPLRVHGPANHVPAIGAQVQIQVIGQAHVFP